MFWADGRRSHSQLEDLLCVEVQVSAKIQNTLYKLYVRLTKSKSLKKCETRDFRFIEGQKFDLRFSCEHQNLYQ